MSDVLKGVKDALGITGEYQDTTLNFYIEEVKEYMKGAGVPESVVNSASSIGVISRGVADLWNYGSGEAKLSNYFMQRVIQLAYKKEQKEDEQLQTERTVYDSDDTFETGDNCD